MDNQTTFLKTKNIAFICFSSSFGGLELSMLKLASEFNKRNANCLIVVPPETPLASAAKQNNLLTAFIKTKLKYGDLAASIRLSRILRQNNIDIAIVMQSKDMSIVTLAHLIIRSVKLAFYQEMQFSINKRDIIHTWMYSHLSLWFTLTKKMKREVIEHTRMNEERIIDIPIGTDMTRFDPHRFNQIAARDKFGIPQSKIILGVLGRLDIQKGQEDLIRAFPVIIRNKPDVHLVIAGEETKGQHGYKKRLEDLCHEHGIGSHIQFLPFTDNVPEFLSAIDIFVLPSHSETFGFVLVEAMAMEKPIVATNAGGVPEIITDGVTGLLVPPQNEKALADAVLKLLGDEKLKLTLSSKARTDAKERFDVAKCIDKLVLSLDAL